MYFSIISGVNNFGNIHIVIILSWWIILWHNYRCGKKELLGYISFLFLKEQVIKACWVHIFLILLSTYISRTHWWLVITLKQFSIFSIFWSFLSLLVVTLWYLWFAVVGDIVSRWLVEYYVSFFLFWKILKLIWLSLVNICRFCGRTIFLSVLLALECHFRLLSLFWILKCSDEFWVIDWKVRDL